MTAAQKWISDISLGGSGPVVKLANEILAEFLRYRRLADPDDACSATVCVKCATPHLAKVIYAISKALPITFVLPAFPGKSPNPEKVLGPLPDMAEQRSLEFLGALCQRVKQRYKPGAQIILCSDGRVFSDTVGMHDDHVTAYQAELSSMIQRLSLSAITTVNLDEIYGKMNFDEMRRRLMDEYGESLTGLKESVRRGYGQRECSDDDIEAHRLYCGITRFLVEDSIFPGQVKSRTAIQRESRVRAYEVIRRSKAWSNLIANQFPHAVRLSIHPQKCGSKKLGIRLLQPDHWMTPWHGVAVEVNGDFTLMRHSQARALGARLQYKDRRPSHFVIENLDGISSTQGVECGI